MTTPVPPDNTPTEAPPPPRSKGASGIYKAALKAVENMALKGQESDADDRKSERKTHTIITIGLLILLAGSIGMGVTGGWEAIGLTLKATPAAVETPMEMPQD